MYDVSGVIIYFLKNVNKGVEIYKCNDMLRVDIKNIEPHYNIYISITFLLRFYEY